MLAQTVICFIFTSIRGAFRKGWKRDGGKKERKNTKITLTSTHIVWMFVFVGVGSSSVETYFVDVLSFCALYEIIVYTPCTLLSVCFPVVSLTKSQLICYFLLTCRWMLTLELFFYRVMKVFYFASHQLCNIHSMLSNKSCIMRTKNLFSLLL